MLADLPVSPGGLTADGAARRVLEVAPELDTSRAEATQTRDAVGLGAAAFAPRLDLGATYTRLSELDQSPMQFGQATIAPFPQYLNRYGARVTLTLPVSDIFLVTAPRYAAAEQIASFSALQDEARRQRFAFEARRAFYGYLRARAGELVARDYVALLKAYVRDLQGLVRAGQNTEADVLQAAAQLAVAEAHLAEAAGAVRVTSVALAALLELEESGELPIGAGVFATAPSFAGDEHTIRQAALAARPEVRALQALIAAQSERVRALQGTRLPRLGAFGNLDAASPNQRIFPQQDELRTSWEAGLSLSWSPNDFVVGRIPVDQAEVEVVRAQNELRNLENQLRIEAARAASGWQVATQTRESARQGVAAARAAWTARWQLLQAGETTANDVLDAATALRQAELAEVDAEIATHLAHAHIQYVVGQAIPGRTAP